MAQDLICGMEVDEKEAKKKGMALKRSGETLYFCSESCKEKFKKKSTFELAKCAMCMQGCTLGKTVWKIRHKGKLYCFDSKKCKEKFEKRQFGEVIY